jgi:hypothetical protein
VREVDLSIVTYRPDLALLAQLLASLAEPMSAPTRRRLYIQDNSPEPETVARILELPQLRPGAGFDLIDVKRSASNVGFGRGHNANAGRGAGEFSSC